MYARDGIRGAFLEGVGEQVDCYVTMKLLDDPSLNIDTMLDEFFTRYYGAAGGPLKRFYLRVEDIYSNPANYPEEVRTNLRKHFHQTEELAWKYLGTEARMAELGKLMAEAEKANTSDVEKQRVALFRKAVWDYMVQGRKQYLAKQPKQSASTHVVRPVDRIKSFCIGFDWGPGGANCAMGDGSATFFNETIDFRLYNNLGTRAGGEVVQVP